MLAKREDMVLDELASIVGKENATAEKHIRYAYSYDLVLCEASSCRITWSWPPRWNRFRPL